jgi:hypothetical protein
MPRKLPALSLSPSQQQQTQQWLTAHGTPQQVVLRGRIVLATAEGRPESSVAEQLRTHRKTVRLWRTRFAEQGLESLWQVAPGRQRYFMFNSLPASFIDDSLDPAQYPLHASTVCHQFPIQWQAPVYCSP